jgi:phospholipase/carboxylesterase
MTRELKAGRRAPKSGQTDSAVIFLHGYGADGADLLSLADPLAPHMPGTAFLAPDAPEPCAASPMGRQWFPIPWIDGSSEQAAEDGMLAAAEDLNAFLDGVLVSEGITPDRLILLGFSQGTMMSLHVAPRRPDPVACVVGFSGRLLGPERLARETVSRMPVLLLHGDADEVVPYGDMQTAAEALAGAGFDIYTHTMERTGHGIAPDGLQQAFAFMAHTLESGATKG